MPKNIIVFITISTLIILGIFIYKKSRINYHEYNTNVSEINHLKQLEILLDEDVLFAKANRVPNHKNFETHNKQIEVLLDTLLKKSLSSARGLHSPLLQLKLNIQLFQTSH